VRLQELENAVAKKQQQTQRTPRRTSSSSTASSNSAAAKANKVTDLQHPDIHDFLGKECREFLCNVDDEIYSAVLGSGGCRGWMDKVQGLLYTG
jgi:hypothetical protein